MRKLSLWFLIVSLCIAGYSFADSVWNDKSASPYSTDRSYKVGDIVYVLIMESTSARSGAGIDTNVKDDLSAKFTHTLQRLSPIIGANNQAVGQWGNKYKGTGQTSRSSDFQARISAWVTEVLPNGNLAIKGRHKVIVNEEEQEITITGIVRPKDISGANTINSYNVANAIVSYKGEGVVAESASKGWLSRIIDWLF